MTGRRVNFSKNGHVTSFDDVFSDEGSKHLRNRKEMSAAKAMITFTVQHEKGNHSKLIEELKEREEVNISHVETRPSGADKDVYLECLFDSHVYDAISRLKNLDGVTNVSLRNDEETKCILDVQSDDFPWFPRCLTDLDRCAANVLMYGSELDADHPGFKDETYRNRRAFFTNIARNYKHGDAIPRVDYTEEEIKTWNCVYTELTKLYPKHACKEHIENLALLEEKCGFRVDNIPQLDDVSRFLQNRTGFRLRPVAGFLSPRDFLAGLALKVFNCTQYIRHSSDPFYTPEPDACHELLGHVPLLADPSFAEFSQQIGLSSLGASEADISKLAACYLYTVEFGLVKENEIPKAYGAGLLSCIAELKHALTSPEKIKTFDPEVASTQEFYVTTFQPVYFMSETLEEAKAKMRKFVGEIRRPFSVKYHSDKNTIEIVQNKGANNAT